MGVLSASAISDIDCIFSGQNTGFATAIANGSISGSSHLDLVAEGEGSADTGFILVPGRESAFQSALADSTVSLSLLVTGGAAAGLLSITASQCEMLAGVFGEFRVNGTPEQDLTGCGAGTQVVAPYTRDVPFEISWFIHAEAFSTENAQGDDVGRFRFDSFQLLTTDSGSNPDASLTLLDIPEPSSILLVSAGVATILALSRWRHRRVSP
jgi:hypothetical protein